MLRRVPLACSAGLTSVTQMQLLIRKGIYPSMIQWYLGLLIVLRCWTEYGTEMFVINVQFEFMSAGF